MNQETYDAHKATIESGKIAIHNGRTIATHAELDDVDEAEDGTPFGGQQAQPGEVMAFYSGRLPAQMIEDLGPEHPLIVASKRLTADQLDGLADYFGETYGTKTNKPAGESETPPAGTETLTLADDVREQAAQAQAATGATDNLTPKTVMDNKTSEDGPAGKNASKTKADAVQAEAKEGAQTAS